MRYLLVSTLFLCSLHATEQQQASYTEIKTVEEKVHQAIDIDKIKALEERISKVSSIMARADVLIKAYQEEREEREERGLSGVILADSQNNTRMRFDYGGHIIVDYIKTKEIFSLLLPRKDALFVGQIDTVGKADNLIKLMNSNLSGLEIFFPVLWDSKANKRSYKDNQVLIYNDTDEKQIKVYKKIKFDQDFNIKSVFNYDDHGELSGIIHYDDYKLINGNTIPHKISIIVSNNLSITLNITGTTFDNIKTAKNPFQFPEMEGVTKYELTSFNVDYLVNK